VARTALAHPCHTTINNTVGVQVRPNLAMHDFSGSLETALAGAGAAAAAPSGSSSSADVASWLHSVTSVAMSYSPEARTRAGERRAGGGGGGAVESHCWLVPMEQVSVLTPTRLLCTPLLNSPCPRHSLWSHLAGQHSFTASMEMQEGRSFVISFFQV
jgi:hypothetical protein